MSDCTIQGKVLQTEVILPDHALEDAVGATLPAAADIKPISIRMDRIEAYFPNPDESAPNTSLVVMFSGVELILNLTYEELDSHILACVN